MAQSSTLVKGLALAALLAAFALAGQHPVRAAATWVTRAPMPTARSAFAAGVVGGKLYAVGGATGAGALNTVEAYDPATNTWTAKAPMPTARYYLGVGVVNGILYAVGGEDPASLPYPSYLATVEAYDPATDTWTAKAPMPTARGGLAVGVVNGILYAIGGGGEGIGSSSPLATVEAYDPAANTWAAKAPLPEVHYGGVAVGAVGGILYSVAADGAGASALLAYDPGTNAWTAKTPMPLPAPIGGIAGPRWHAAAAAVDGILYVAGGWFFCRCNNTNYYYTTVAAYDPVSDGWAEAPSMSTGRTALAATVASGALYALGGYNRQNGYLPTVESIEAPLADSDGDARFDVFDNCPQAANPGQQNTDGQNASIGRPGADKLGDACDDDIDGDGYSNGAEAALGKSATAYCSAMRADVDGDGVVSILDLATIGAHFLQPVTPAIERQSQDADQVISILDIATAAGAFLKHVTACP